MSRLLILVGFALLVIAPPLLASDLPTDPGLDKTVNLAIKGEALWDVMKMLNKQTGVQLRASHEIVDQKATIFVDNKPLREVMNGLVTVFPYKWTGSRSGRGRCLSAGKISTL